MNIAVTGLPAEHIFWGKLNPAGPVSLSLNAHCLDVAMTFREMAELPGFRRTLEAAAKRELDYHDMDRLAVLAMIHDIGKANLGFQMKVFDPGAPRAGHTREIEAVFRDDRLLERFAQALDVDTLLSWADSQETMESFFMASWSHHGRPLRFDGAMTGKAFLAAGWWMPKGQWDPMQEISRILQTAKKAFPRAFHPQARPLPQNPRFHHRFAGLLMLADWLGSHPAWFPVERTDYVRRLKRDRAVIPLVLKSIGLDPRHLPGQLDNLPEDFQGRFGFSPRPLQELMDGLDLYDPEHRLIIAESDTGSGKTEAALQWFLRLFREGKVDSLYFALPTRVAARELYSRILSLMTRFFPEPDTRPATVLAVPGYAMADGEPVKTMLPDLENLCLDDMDFWKKQRRWASEQPKRFLAATVAVGTVDQALLSSIQTAHCHLRSVCLDRSLLVVDEVHASDTYMGCLLSSLLNHHVGHAKGFALLLSATLGSTARTRFLDAVREGTASSSLEDAIKLPYPCIIVKDGTCVPTARHDTVSKEVRFEFVPLAGKPEELADIISQSLAKGARVMVVMNTVNRAVGLLRDLEAESRINSRWLFSCAGKICPHHGRFAPGDREILDREVTRVMGKGSSAAPLLLIGTQTLEQSLDIDADLLITDLCPADVLLQRVGRLHRHDRRRPEGFSRPRCMVLVPEVSSLEHALDSRGEVLSSYKKMGYGSVYEDLRTLELTLEALRENQVARIPQDNRWLVEHATHETMLSSLKGRKWDLHAQAVSGRNIMQELAAGTVTVSYDKFFGDFVFNEAGEKVMTRLGADSLRLSLERPVESPFGVPLREMIIPGHMKPAAPSDTVYVLEEEEGLLVLGCGDRRYTYSRFGIEEQK